MIGDMIAKVRKEKGMTKTELAKITGINIGHLTHIEKGERNPSHKALKNICNALNIPYQQLMFTYDKTVSEEQESYDLIKHISYNRVLALGDSLKFIECPPEYSSASIAIQIKDDSMSNTLNIGDFAFIELNSLLNNKELGLFNYNGDVIIRTFISKKGKITLKASNKKYKDITVSQDDSFFIIGRILNS